LPRVTVVTPSFNQGQFIEETLRSVLLQGYPDIEYFVLDGGSNDNSVEVIQRYSPWLSFWVSERDRGQSAAINRGLRMGTGTYATWINSDDMLCQNALAQHVLNRGLAEEQSDVLYIGDCLNIDVEGAVLFTHRGRVYSLEDLVRIPSVWRADGWIDQPAVLFPLELALRAGGLNESDHYTMDYEFWGKLLIAGAKIQYTGIPFGIFRLHERQKTQHSLKQTESMLNAAVDLVRSGDSFSPETKKEILADLETYRKAYPEAVWKGSGRLARAGLPASLVTQIRSLRRALEKELPRAFKVKGS